MVTEKGNVGGLTIIRSGPSVLSVQTGSDDKVDRYASWIVRVRNGRVIINLAWLYNLCFLFSIRQVHACF